ncbi:MAG: glycoside hydrolase family 5 protein [Chitinophagaceae bacterium]
MALNTLLKKKNPIYYIFQLFTLAILLVACKKYNPNIQLNNAPRADSLLNGTPGFLSRGINLSNWFNDYSDSKQYGTRFNSAHFSTIRSWKINNVRIPIGVTVLFQPNNPSQLNPTNLPWVEAAVKRANDAGLTVTLNLHPWKHDMDSLLANNAAMPQKLAAYWKAMAQQFTKFAPDKLVFEIYNEPHAAVTNLTSKPKSWWYPVQELSIAAIRSVTKEHYIIVGGENWNSWNDLPNVPIYDYPNLIYNFHFYEPYVFTHQGADWANAWWPKLKDIPYPSTPENIAPFIAKAKDAPLFEMLTDYGNMAYNYQVLQSQIRTVVEWAIKNKRMILCNEFGAYKPFAPRSSRLTYLKDVQSIFNQYKIGWALWELDEGFGVLDYTNTNRYYFEEDKEVLKVLGLVNP